MDLTDLEEEQKNIILDCLKKRDNPNVQGPWNQQAPKKVILPAQHNPQPEQQKAQAVVEPTQYSSPPPALEPEEIPQKTVVSPQPQAAPKSWASLLRKPNVAAESNNNGAIISPGKVEHAPTTLLIKETQPQPMNSRVQNPNYYRMAKFFEGFKVDPQIRSLQPRGLINRSNYCYINSILQALLACPPFYNLFHALGENVSIKDSRKDTQIIDNIIRFVQEFKHLAAGQRKNNKEKIVPVNCDKPFEASWIYKMFFGTRSDSFMVEGRQEDAEEFLSLLLNRLNDEMLEVMKMVSEPDTVDVVVEDVADSDNWPKNKGSVTRRSEVVKTPISDIFGGNIRSRLHRAGEKVTDNIQPFFTLQLNIEVGVFIFFLT